MESNENLEACWYNSQPHIDTVKFDLKPNPIFVSSKYTFMLKHKHFDLLSGEVLWVERGATGYDVFVKDKGELGTDIAPCMWISENGWKPFGYTSKEDGLVEIPKFPEGEFNLGVRWLNTGGLEKTDIAERTQAVRPHDGSTGNALVTEVTNLWVSCCAHSLKQYLNVASTQMLWKNW